MSVDQLVVRTTNQTASFEKIAHVIVSLGN